MRYTVVCVETGLWWVGAGGGGGTGKRRGGRAKVCVAWFLGLRSTLGGAYGACTGGVLHQLAVHVCSRPALHVSKAKPQQFGSHTACIQAARVRERNRVTVSPLWLK